MKTKQTSASNCFDFDPVYIVVRVHFGCGFAICLHKRYLAGYRMLSYVFDRGVCAHVCFHARCVARKQILVCGFVEGLAWVCVLACAHWCAVV